MNNMNNGNNNMNNNMNNNYSLSNDDINIPSSQSMGNINMNNPQQQQQEHDEPEGNIHRSEEVIYDTPKNSSPDADVRTIVFETSTSLKVLINAEGRTNTYIFFSIMKPFLNI